MWYEKSGLELNNFLFDSHTLVWEKFSSNSHWLLLQFDFCFSEIKRIAKSVYKHAHVCFHIFGGEKKD